MVEFFAQQVSTQRTDSRIRMTFRVPALSQTIARRRARNQMQGKGFDTVSIESVEVVESGSIPGQTIYEVTVSSPR